MRPGFANPNLLSASMSMFCYSVAGKAILIISSVTNIFIYNLLFNCTTAQVHTNKYNQSLQKVVEGMTMCQQDKAYM